MLSLICLIHINLEEVTYAEKKKMVMKESGIQTIPCLLLIT